MLFLSLALQHHRSLKTNDATAADNLIGRGVSDVQPPLGGASFACRWLGVERPESSRCLKERFGPQRRFLWSYRSLK